MIVIFVHGWSVRNTDTYGGLPRFLATQNGPDGRPLTVKDLFLSGYISVNDTVTLDDISRAFNQALRDVLRGRIRKGERLACITHSTGGPVVRNWIDLYHRRKPGRCPLSHLIMLAPANHGSALAQLGKSRLSRMKFFLQGAEPGERVLDWLELGSDAAWNLNDSWLRHSWVREGLFPFVLTGQTIDRSLYDALNSYTDEMGSDGVVRVASANLNFSLLKLSQNRRGDLVLKELRHAEPTAFGVLPRVAHSGDDIGILRSVSETGERPAAVVRERKLGSAQHPTAEWVVRCLQVADATQYRRLRMDLEKRTAATQDEEALETHRTAFWTRKYPNARCAQVIVRLRDDRGQTLSDYDLFLTAGPQYSEQHLPAGFFVDRQRNQRNRGTLTYFLNWDVLSDARNGLRKPALEGRFGFRIVARPRMPDPAVPDPAVAGALAGYRVLDFKSDLDVLSGALRPNQTLMLDIELKRLVDKAVFRLSNDLTPTLISLTPLRLTVGD
jgi:hypothetical protein